MTEQGPAEQPGVPWVNPEIQQRVKWRAGDIVASVPMKSGTTWTMNIVHQLRSGGDSSFRDIYEEMPWLELVPGPGVTPEDILAAFDALPRSQRPPTSNASPATTSPGRDRGGTRETRRESANRRDSVCWSQKSAGTPN